MKYLVILLIIVLGASCVPPGHAPRPPRPPKPPMPPHGVMFNNLVERPVMV